MAGKGRRNDVLFAVNALSDINFDESDQRAYSDLIGEYFGDSETEAETDTECGKQGDFLLYSAKLELMYK